MASVVADFLAVMGIDSVVPVTLGELIPYLLTVYIAVSLVCACFGLLGKLTAVLLDWGKWR